MSTGHDLRTARLLMGLSQNDMARVLHVTPTSISRWESGGAAHELRRKHALRLEEAVITFQVDRAKLLTPPTKGYQRQSEEEKISRKMERRRLLQMMHEDQKPDIASEQSRLALEAKAAGQPYDESQILPEDVKKPRKVPHDLAGIYELMNRPKRTPTDEEDRRFCQTTSAYWTQLDLWGKRGEIAEQRSIIVSLMHEHGPRTKAFIEYYDTTGLIPLDTNPDCSHIFKE